MGKFKFPTFIFITLLWRIPFCDTKLLKFHHRSPHTCTKIGWMRWWMAFYYIFSSFKDGFTYKTITIKLCFLLYILKCIYSLLPSTKNMRWLNNYLVQNKLHCRAQTLRDLLNRSLVGWHKWSQYRNMVYISSFGCKAVVADIGRNNSQNTVIGPGTVSRWLIGPKAVSRRLIGLEAISRMSAQ